MEEIELQFEHSSLLSFARQQPPARPFQGVSRLPYGGCKDHKMSARLARAWTPYDPKPPSRTITDFASSANLPVAQGRHHRVRPTKKRRHGRQALIREVEIEDELSRNDDGIAINHLGVFAVYAVGRVVVHVEDLSQ